MKQVFNPPSVRLPFGQYNHGLLVPPGASLLETSGQLGIGPVDRWAALHRELRAEARSFSAGRSAVWARWVGLVM